MAKKGKLKKKGLSDRQIQVPFPEAPPEPTQLILDRDPESPGMGFGVMVTHVCEWCNEPFQRPRRGGRQPKYCSDAHRNAANYARNAGTPRPSGERPAGNPPVARVSSRAAELEVLGLIFESTNFTIDRVTAQLYIPEVTIDIPDRLAPTMFSLYRAHEDAMAYRQQEQAQLAAAQQSEGQRVVSVTLKDEQDKLVDEQPKAKKDKKKKNKGN